MQECLIGSYIDVGAKITLKALGGASRKPRSMNHRKRRIQRENLEVLGRNQWTRTGSTSKKEADRGRQSDGVGNGRTNEPHRRAHEVGHRRRLGQGEGKDWESRSVAKVVEGPATRENENPKQEKHQQRHQERERHQHLRIYAAGQGPEMAHQHHRSRQTYFSDFSIPKCADFWACGYCNPRKNGRRTYQYLVRQNKFHLLQRISFECCDFLPCLMFGPTLGVTDNSNFDPGSTLGSK